MSANVESSIRMPAIFRTMALLAAFSYAAGNAGTGAAVPRVVIRKSEIFLVEPSGKSIQLTHDGKPKFNAKLIQRGKSVVYHGDYLREQSLDRIFTVISARDGKIQAEIPFECSRPTRIDDLPCNRIGVLAYVTRGRSNYTVLDVAKKKAVEITYGASFALTPDAMALAPDRDTLIVVDFPTPGVPYEYFDRFYNSEFVGLVRISSLIARPPVGFVEQQDRVTWFWPRGYKLGDKFKARRLKSDVRCEPRFISKRRFFFIEEKNDHRLRCLVFALPSKRRPLPRLVKIIPIDARLHDIEVSEVRRRGVVILRGQFKGKTRRLRIHLGGGRT